MMKTLNNKETMMVSFLNYDKKTVTGKLLAYEIAGDVCILVNQKRVWLPFTELSQSSRKAILGSAAKTYRIADGPVDPKPVLAVTLLVLVVFSFYYVRLGM